MVSLKISNINAQMRAEQYQWLSKVDREILHKGRKVKSRGRGLPKESAHLFSEHNK